MSFPPRSSPRSAESSSKRRGAKRESDYESLITVTVVTDRQTRWVSGTVYADGRPRIINIKGIRMDAEFGPSMLYVTNQDKPGFVGRFATLLAGAGINIATFHLGRESEGGNAIALVEVDAAVPARSAGAGAENSQRPAGQTAAFLIRLLEPPEHTVGASYPQPPAASTYACLKGGQRRAVCGRIVLPRHPACPQFGSGRFLGR